MALKRREQIEAREGIDLGRRARKGASSLSYTVLVVALVVLAMGLSVKLRHRFDVSAGGGNVLSPQTLQVLDGLSEPVQLYPLFTSGHPGREAYRYLLQQYRDASSNIEVEFIDPVERPGAVQRLGLDPSQESARGDGVTVVARGDARRVFVGVEEEAVTNAILDAGSSVRRVVGFVGGHGTRDPTSSNSTGMALAAGALAQEYYDLADVSLEAGIPAEVTVLILAGPRLELTESNRETLRQWLENGGRLMLMVDPGFDPGLTPMLARWGLEYTGTPVIEPRRLFRRENTALKVLTFTDHNIVRGFGTSLPIGLSLAGSVRHFEPDDHQVFHTALARSSDFSWERQLDGTRTGGPFALGVVAWVRDELKPDSRETRIVLIGDSDFASNEFLPYDGNRNLFLNCIGWLSQQQGGVSIRRQQLADQALDVHPVGLPVLAAAFATPLLVLLGGIAVLARRRGL